MTTGEETTVAVALTPIRDPEPSRIESSSTLASALRETLSSYKERYNSPVESRRFEKWIGDVCARLTPKILKVMAPVCKAAYDALCGFLKFCKFDVRRSSSNDNAGFTPTYRALHEPARHKLEEWGASSSRLESSLPSFEPSLPRGGSPTPSDDELDASSVSSAFSASTPSPRRERQLEQAKSRLDFMSEEARTIARKNSEAMRGIHSMAKMQPWVQSSGRSLRLRLAPADLPKGTLEPISSPGGPVQLSNVEPSTADQEQEELARKQEALQGDLEQWKGLDADRQREILDADLSSGCSSAKLCRMVENAQSVKVLEKLVLLHKGNYDVCEQVCEHTHFGQLPTEAKLLAVSGGEHSTEKSAAKTTVQSKVLRDCLNAHDFKSSEVLVTWMQNSRSENTTGWFTEKLDPTKPTVKQFVDKWGDMSETEQRQLMIGVPFSKLTAKLLLDSEQGLKHTPFITGLLRCVQNGENSTSFANRYPLNPGD